MNGSNLFVDTNILIYLFSGHQKLVEILENQNLYISVITEIELLAYPNLSQNQEARIRDFISNINIININTNIKEIAIQIKKSYKIKLPDALIASSAIDVKMPLFSADTIFEKIDSLEFRQYKLV